VTGGYQQHLAVYHFLGSETVRSWRCRAQVSTSQVRAARAANSELLQLYWSVGRDILDRQEQALARQFTQLRSARRLPR